MEEAPIRTSDTSTSKHCELPLFYSFFRWFHSDFNHFQSSARHIKSQEEEGGLCGDKLTVKGQWEPFGYYLITHWVFCLEPAEVSNNRMLSSLRLDSYCVSKTETFHSK